MKSETGKTKSADEKTEKDAVKSETGSEMAELTMLKNTEGNAKVNASVMEFIQENKKGSSQGA